MDVIGVPYDFGQPKGGVENGPSRLREAGILSNVGSLGIVVRDKGNLAFDSFPGDPKVGNVKRPRAVSSANKKIADTVADSLREGQSCLVLGGDHSLAIGSIYGQAQVQEDLCVIWVDAHGDINPPLESPSGNCHGMPLAFLVHELRDKIPDELAKVFSWLKPCIHLKDIAYIAVRDLDEPEKKIMADNGMVVYSAEDVKNSGIENVVKQAIERVNPGGNKQVHLSFDIDALDPEYAPSTGTAVPGGLTAQEGVYIVQTLAKTGQLAVLDLVEVNPELGDDLDKAKTLDSAKKIAAAWFTAIGEL